MKKLIQEIIDQYEYERSQEQDEIVNNNILSENYWVFPLTYCNDYKKLPIKQYTKEQIAQLEQEMKRIGSL